MRIFILLIAASVDGYAAERMVNLIALNQLTP
jgi:hypothetical protein